MEQNSYITLAEDNATIILSGEWIISNLEGISAQIDAIASRYPDMSFQKICGKKLQKLDTACCSVLFLRISSLKNVKLEDFKDTHSAIFNMIRERVTLKVDLKSEEILNPVQEIGQSALVVFAFLSKLIAFIGEVSCSLIAVILNPFKFRFKEFVAQLELAFVNAIPIVCLVTFLIGVVIAYLFASQTERFGVGIFIVDAVSLGMCREFSPLIVAVILAGRSGSAFTAQLGTMKLNEEIDAMQMLGMSPLRSLVLPRLFALIIAMPCLVFIGDIVGIAAGGFVADYYLGITPPTFIDRLQSVLKLKSVMVGLIKAPVFAIFVALIGCRLGLDTENNARSIGLNTTASVVQSIVSVILLNAAFAIIFVELGI